MDQHRPSATAMMTAFGRAMHVLQDPPPHVFVDPFAWPILGSHTEGLLALASTFPEEGLRSFRAEWILRARIAEERLLSATERGTRQCVILGAGLDTLAWRHESALVQKSVVVYEVDHPATQDWKRERLAALGMRVPSPVVFTPVDFKTDDLFAALESAGFDRSSAAFVSMLGVVMYLETEATFATLTALASLPAGTEVCLSYQVPESLRTPDAAALRSIAAAVVAAEGEPFVAQYTPNEIEDLLREAGFNTVTHVGADEAARIFDGRTDGLTPDGVERLVIATDPAAGRTRKRGHRFQVSNRT